MLFISFLFSSVQSISRAITNSRNPLKLMSIESVMPSAISSSVVPFSSCPQSLPATGSFPMSQLFACSLVAQSCPALCDPMNRSMPGLPVHHQLPEFAQTHVHRAGAGEDERLVSLNQLLFSSVSRNQSQVSLWIIHLLFSPYFEVCIVS